MIPCPFVLAALPAAPPPAKPAAEVTVSARVLQLPPLPVSATQALARQEEVRKLVTESLEDLEADLTVLYADPLARADLPPSLRVPRALAGEVRFLVAMVEDPELEELTRGLHEAWGHYVDFLVRAHLAEPPKDWKSGTPPAAADPAGDAELAARLARRGRSLNVLIGEAKDLVWLIGRRSAKTPTGSYETAEAQVDAAWTQRTQVDRGVETRRKQMAVADREAPSLAAAWAPLATHFNDRAAKLLAFEPASLKEPPPDPAIRILRVQARIAFLERFRENLWFCGSVWALMSSGAPPAPLKPLDRYD